MHSRRMIAILSLLLTTALAAEHAWQCYAPDGVTTPGNSSVYLPCIDIQGVHSMCCALNRTFTDKDPDSCAPNGLCLSGGDYFRDFCTDPTWESPNCLPKNVCDDAAGGSSNGTPSLTHCADGTWCCNSGNQTCCTQKKGFSIPDLLLSILPGPGNAKGSSNSSTSNTTSPTPSPSSSTTATVQSDNSKTTAVGVGVGVSLGVIAIVGTIAGFWFGQKRGQSLASKRLQEQGNGNGNGMYMGNGTHAVNGAELPAKGEYRPVTEQAANTGGVHEVPASPIGRF